MVKFAMARILGITALAGLLINVLLLVQWITPLSALGSFAFTASQPVWQRRADNTVFLLGAGKADITGPVVEIGLNGYADINQVGSGLRQRIYSRAFIIADIDRPEDTFIYIVLDAHSGDTAIRDGILKGLASLGGEYARYGEHNLALTGTHSHAGPGAWMNYLLPQVPTKGFDKQSYQAIVDGVLLSIKRAHESLAPGDLSVGTIEIPDGNINRSPYAYLANPEEERARYKYDTDKTLTLLRFDRASDNKTAAILTFFSVHGTSLYQNNTLTAGDNKGVAAWLFERSVRNDSRFADNFVAGFSQSSVGDTSPNVLGAYCEDTGLPCRFEDSTCDGKTQKCRARGPYFTENDGGSKSCFEIGRRQFAAAKKLYEEMDHRATLVEGHSVVSSFHVYHDFTDYEFPSPFNSSVLKTCYAALGFSFAAGTTDGPGQFDFTQNSSTPAEDNPLWYIARAFIHQPSEEQKACQAPKDILIDAGGATLPYAWAPNIVDIQVLRVGELLIVVSASEVTTMAGRRWKSAIASAVTEILDISEPLVLLGAPANTYAHYVTTEEEYSVQRYEGGSTLYGPNTLAGYVNLTLTYLPYLGSASERSKLAPIPSGPKPPVNTDKSLSFIPGVVYDGAPIGKSFGDVLSTSPNVTYQPGDTIEATFVGANPRNNLRLEGTFAAVEWLNSSSNKWQVVRTDEDWNLVYQWKRTNTILGHSEVTISWQIEDSFYSTGSPNPVESGLYRLHYFGDSKNAVGKIESFEGVTGPFTVQV